MVGITCSGDYCDNIQLRCASVGPVSSCVSAPAISEESPPFFDLGNRFVRRMSCSGSYCDNVGFEMCRVNATAATCQGACGGLAASGTCFCDTECDSFGDCCADVGAMCR